MRCYTLVESRALLINISLPPRERYFLLQQRQLSVPNMPSQTADVFAFSPKGRPRYLVGKEPTLQARIPTTSRRLEISITG